MNREEKHIEVYANQRFYNMRKHEQLQDELLMLGEYVDEIAEHPCRTGFFQRFIRKEKNSNVQNKIEWNLLSSEEKVKCYREYIDEINSSSVHLGLQQPESSEWYDEWLTYWMADP